MGTRSRDSGRMQEGRAKEVIRDRLEKPAPAGARQILTVALEEEVENYLGRGPYDRGASAATATAAHVGGRMPQYCMPRRWASCGRRATIARRTARPTIWTGL